MSNSFEITLRSKSAEQLLNMKQNNTAWSPEQNQLIANEIKKRGLEIFEEPEPWKHGTMEDLDLINPKSDFEENMAVIIAHDRKEKEQKNINLASQIVSISSVIVNFAYLNFLGYENGILGIASVLLGFTSIAFYISKNYLLSLILGSVSLFIVALMLLLHLKQFI